MDETWWVNQEQLDEIQTSAIKAPLDQNILLTGPPGSGKSNLILLRATRLHIEESSNFAIVLFTRSLAEFLSSGHYDIPSERITTYTSFVTRFLRDNSAPLPDKNSDFTAVRNHLHDHALPIVTSPGFRPPFDYLLIDEAQDLLPRELLLLRRMTKRLYVAGDPAQTIYKTGSSTTGSTSSWMAELAFDLHIKLPWSYRCGREICSLADELSRGIGSAIELGPITKYDEERYPSSVSTHVNNMSNLLDHMMRKVEMQIETYPTGRIGIIVPKNRYIEPIFDALRRSRLSNQVARLDIDPPLVQNESKKVLLSTIHGAKGLEFRAVHVFGLEDRRIPMPRPVAFVCATRAKTTLSIYAERDLPDYLSTAQRASTLRKSHNNGAGTPSMDSLFKGKRR